MKKKIKDSREAEGKWWDEELGDILACVATPLSLLTAGLN
jgi:hypothetical protein